MEGYFCLFYVFTTSMLVKLYPLSLTLYHIYFIHKNLPVHCFLFTFYLAISDFIDKNTSVHLFLTLIPNSVGRVQIAFK